MPPAQGKAANVAAPNIAARNIEPPLLTVSDLVLIRACVQGGATRAELQRDLASLVAPRISGTSFRRAAEFAIGQHAGQDRLAEMRGRLTVTPAGLQRAQEIANSGRVARETWSSTRNHILVALSLSVNGDNPAVVKALERPERLAALTLQQHFGLASARPLSLANLRAGLAVIALEKAFGNKIKTGLGKGSGLPGKTARLLAGQLFRKPREFASDGKLVCALAAEVTGALNDGHEALRMALLRRLTASPERESGSAEGLDEDDEVFSSHMAQPRPANDPAPLTAPPPRISAPDMGEFVSSVLDAARPISQGWPGNRKAFISRVWQAIRLARREWELTEIAFKSMLAEAHRRGQLMLATADLKDKTSLKDLEESKILYKNTVWHFVRVED